MSAQNPADLGHNIKGWMHYVHMSQVQLAEASDLSEGMISRFLNGKTDVSLSKLFDIAAALGLEPILLMTTPPKGKHK